MNLRGLVGWEAWFVLLTFGLATILQSTGSRAHSVFYLVAAIGYTLIVLTLIKDRKVLAGFTGGTLVVGLLFGALLDVGAITYGPSSATSGYTSTGTATALNVLTMGSAFFLLISLVVLPRRQRVFVQREVRLGIKPSVVAVAALTVGNTLAWLSVSGATVFKYQYSSAAHAVFQGPLNYPGVGLISLFLLVVSITVARQAWGTSWRWKGWVLLVLVIVLVVFLSRGGRSKMVALCLAIGVMYLWESKLSVSKKVTIIVGATGLLYIGILFWGYMRLVAFELSWQEAVAASWSRGVLPYIGVGFEGQALPAQAVPIIGQSYSHLLHTIDLVGEGVVLGGESFTNWVPRQIPSFLAEGLGIERPIGAARKLRQYRQHGGGAYLPAIGYWNFGAFGVIMMAGFMALSVAVVERYLVRVGTAGYGIYLALVGMLPITVLYGLQPYTRVLEVAGLLVVGVIVFGRLMSGGRVMVTDVAGRGGREGKVRRVREDLRGSTSE